MNERGSFVGNESLDGWYPPGVGKGRSCLAEPIGYIGNCTLENSHEMKNRINISTAADCEMISVNGGCRRLKRKSEEFIEPLRKIGEKL